MKIRHALPLICVLSLLMLSFGSASAQSDPAYPYGVELSLDLASITHDFNQTEIIPDTVRGTMKDMSGLGASNMVINITAATQWVIFTKVGGNLVQNGDVISLSSSQTIPVEIIIYPYADRADTESYCIHLSLSPTYPLSHQCITLALTDKTASVNTDLQTPSLTLVPNPASTYISVRGLGEVQANYQYEIYSGTGAEVRQGILTADARINIEDLSSGTYRLRILDGKQSVSSTTSLRGTSIFTVVH
ncbi:MAG: T9SS type A sorting domain-containing protein [Ignavibacteriota bacterium]